MCTLISIDQTFYLENTKEVRHQILRDGRGNPHGWSLICVDPLNEYLDMHVQVQNVSVIIALIESFMGACSNYGRIFLHARFATTEFTGVAFNHGFTNSRGVMIQHNGVIQNYRDLAVDSFNFVDYDVTTAYALRNDLLTADERWANVFLVRPSMNTYGVVRMKGGTLYMDHNGNYSTNPFEDINIPVGDSYARDHLLLPQANSGMGSPLLSQEEVDQLAHPEEDTAFESAWDSYIDKKYRVSR